MWGKAAIFTGNYVDITYVFEVYMINLYNIYHYCISINRTKEECEINCVNLDSENSYERHFFHRLKGLFSDRILNNFGLDGPNPNR